MNHRVYHYSMYHEEGNKKKNKQVKLQTVANESMAMPSIIGHIPITEMLRYKANCVFELMRYDKSPLE